MLDVYRLTVLGAFQFGSECYCGNKYGLYGRVDSATAASVCDVQCTGNGLQICGGTLLNSIYYVNGQSQHGFSITVAMPVD